MIKGTYTTKDLYTYKKDMKLFGRAYIPDGAKEKETMIICHGFGASHNELKNDAIMLAEAGYTSICIDFCGGGGSKSDGDFLKMSAWTEKDDLDAMIDYVKTLDFVDEENIYIMGESQGGMVCAMTAADRPSDIKGMVLLYPAFCIPDVLKTRYESIENVPEEFVFFNQKSVGKIYAENIIDFDVYADAVRYEGPVLIVHGTNDRFVNVRYASLAAQKYKNANLHLISGAGHGFYGETDEFVMELVKQFIEENR